MKLQKKSLKLISIILIIIIEAAISIYTLTGLLRTRETVVFQPDMLDEDNATPYFTLDQGIYAVSVGYEDGGGGDLLLSRSVAKPMPEENTIFSDETKFRPGEDRIAYELYVRFNGTSLRIENNLSEKSGELSLREISLTYLKKRSISYFSLRLLILWLIIDLLLYCILFKSAGFLAFIRKHRFSILLGAAAIFIAVFPVLQPMLQEGDDFDFHLQRLQALSDSLRHGIFPAKIQSGWLGGSGYAAGALYGDLLMYPAAMLNILGFPLGSCYRAYLIAMTVLCYIIGLFSFGKISGDEKLGAISSAFYTLSLYRLIDVHVRSAAGEYSALSFIPLIILGLHLIYAEKKRGWHYIAWGAFGVVETHLLSSVILIEFIVLFCLIRFKDTFKKETLLELLKAAAASIAVNAFYIIPFLDVYFGENLNGMNGDGVLRSMENNAVYLNSLFIPIDSSDHFVWISLGAGYGVLLLLMLFSLLNGWWERLGPDGRAALVLTFLSLFMSTNLFPYTELQLYCPPLYGIMALTQFPWRYFTVAMALMSALLPSLLEAIREKYGKYRLSAPSSCTGKADTDNNAKKAAFAAAAVLLLISCLQDMDYLGKAYAGSKNIMAINAYSYHIAEGEYLPKDTEVFDFYDKSPKWDSEGDMSVETISFEGLKYIAKINNPHSEDHSLTVPLLYYRGYVVSIANGEHSDILPYERAKNGFVGIVIPAGSTGTLTVEFKNPILWTAASVITAISLILLVICSYKVPVFHR